MKDEDPAVPGDVPATDRDLLDEVDEAINALEAHPEIRVRDLTARLLAGIDAVHRAGLTHLVNGIRGMAGDAFLNRLVSDPAIRLLLASYDLIAVDRRLQAEEALDMVRGHLHDHGIDVEIREVTGGVVYVRLHHSAPRAAEHVAPAGNAVRRDLEAALDRGFVGFQELVIGEPDGVPPAPAVVPLASLRGANRPEYYDALAFDDLAPGTMQAVNVNGAPVLLAKVGGEVYALRNQCGDSPLPLQLGRLEGETVICPWHGCRFDLRTGVREGRESGRVHVFPVALRDGRILVAAGIRAGEADL